MNSTDDRPPTVYFKVKTHKTTFRTSTTEHEEIYTYKNGAQELLPISRAIVNHKNSITSSSCDMLLTLIKPIIEQSKYLTSDIFDRIHQLCKHGLPDTIYTGDIEAFYPNTPHDLILDAFKHYNPLLRTERQLLRRLLNFNYATDGRHYYNFGNTGIPMGLPIAPELARMCTAYLLKDYNPPPGQSLTIYFDDIAASYPLENILLEPYTVKPTDTNQTQDCRYDPQKKHFIPIQQQFRQPVLLNPMSYHPSANMAKNTYKSSAFRATKIGTNPADTLHYLLLKYLRPS